jgi:hypothetical protein
LFRIKAAPLGKSSGSIQLEVWSGVEAAFRIEQVVNRGVDGGEFLQTPHPAETLHGAFSSAEWEMRILDAVVEPPSGPLLFERP